MRRLSITSRPASHGSNNGSTNAPRAPDCPGARGFANQRIAARPLAATTSAEVDPQPDQACAKEHERRGLGHGGPAVYLTDDGGAADVEDLEEDVVVVARIECGQGAA